MYDFSLMVPEIELRELRVFLTLAEELHFGRAGDRLQIDRSPVSQVIATLETRIGGKLFERTSRRVRLTALGEQLRAGVAPVYEQLRREIALVQETATGATGTLRIGTYSAMLLGRTSLRSSRRSRPANPALARHTSTPAPSATTWTGFELRRSTWSPGGSLSRTRSSRSDRSCCATVGCSRCCRSSAGPPQDGGGGGPGGLPPSRMSPTSTGR